MVDFKNISPDKAQAIVSALKDGSISSKEMKDLGLTEQEAAELNRAFSSGEARIGDFVLVNKNKSENENSQNSASLEAKGKQSNEESDWWDKTCDFVKEHAGGLAAGGLFIGGGILSATGFASGLGVPMMLAGAAIGLSSCSPDTEILQNVAVTITESSTLRDTVAA